MVEVISKRRKIIYFSPPGVLSVDATSPYNNLVACLHESEKRYYEDLHFEMSKHDEDHLLVGLNSTAFWRGIFLGRHLPDIGSEIISRLTLLDLIHLLVACSTNHRSVKFINDSSPFDFFWLEQREMVPESLQKTLHDAMVCLQHFRIFAWGINNPRSFENPKLDVSYGPYLSATADLFSSFFDVKTLVSLSSILRRVMNQPSYFLRRLDDRQGLSFKRITKDGNIEDFQSFFERRQNKLDPPVRKWVRMFDWLLFAGPLTDIRSPHTLDWFLNFGDSLKFDKHGIETTSLDFISDSNLAFGVAANPELLPKEKLVACYPLVKKHINFMAYDLE